MTKDPNDMLIEELKKSMFSIVEVTTVNPNKRRTSINILSIKANKEADKTKKDLNLIVFLLKQLTGFSKFYKFNFLTDDIIRNAAPYINHVKYSKGSIVFKEGEFSSKFYIIGKGRISMRIKKVSKTHQKNKSSIKPAPDNKVMLNPLKKMICNGVISSKNFVQNKNNSSFHNIEDDIELIVFGPGDCFGEWAIIFNAPRSATAYVIEDSDLFYLEKNHFTDHLAKQMIKAETDRKYFLKSRVPAFMTMDKFDMFYKRIIPMIVDRNKVIYTENSKGKFIYIIFNGEFVIEKDFIIHRSQGDIHEEKKISILNLDKGAFAGLEIIFNKEKVYNYSLKSKLHEFNVIFKIDVETMESYKESIIKDLREYYIKEKQILDDYSERHKMLKQNVSVSYRTLLPREEDVDIMIIKKRDIELVKRFKGKLTCDDESSPNIFKFKKIKLNVNLLKTIDVAIKNRNMIEREQDNEKGSCLSRKMKSTEKDTTNNFNTIGSNSNAKTNSYNNNRRSRSLGENTNLFSKNNFYLRQRENNIPKFNNISTLTLTPNIIQNSINLFERNSNNTMSDPMTSRQIKNNATQNKYINACVDSWKNSASNEFKFCTINWNLPLVSARGEVNDESK